MTRSIEKQILSVVNASGFPFQIRVAGLVDETASQHGWTVLASEHPWATGRDRGFIDLVLGNDRDSLRLVVECKRLKDGQWAFINSRPSAVEFSRVFVTSNSEQGKAGAWADCDITPKSSEASFCSVRGDGSGRTPLIERLAGEICAATEAFARQELSIESPGSIQFTTLYLPVIVTNVQLFEVSVDPSNIDLKSGSVVPEHASVEPTKLIRFRKPLDFDPSDAAKDVRSANQEAERTVLVVNAEGLADVLRALAPIRIISDSPRARYAARMR